MLSRIDRWIGRHMSARRWIVFWLMVAAGSSSLAGSSAAGGSALWWGWLPLVFIGSLMVLANAQRVK